MSAFVVEDWRPAIGARVLTDLDKETWEREWILPHHDASTIADHLGNAAPEHGEEKSPSSPFDALNGVNDQGYAEKYEEADVGCQ